MIFSALLAAVLSVLSPFWGLIFIVAFGDKYRERGFRLIYIVTFVATVLILFFLSFIDILVFADIIIGVALASFIYFFIYYRVGNYGLAIISAAVIDIVYGIFRFFVLGNIFLTKLKEISASYLEILGSGGIANEEQLLFVKEMLNTMEYIAQKYYAGIWAFLMIIAFYIGSLLLSRREQNKWNHKSIRVNFYWVYTLIFGLALFVIADTRTIAINFLMMISTVFLMEGFSIIDYYWGDYFKKAKFLLYIMIMALAINPYLMGLIFLMGLTDIWFNYRKI